jgi:predicted unusual protein kinase regulating ubiquinone biosynthesis (AarF/ABC1/UbiB family)
VTATTPLILPLPPQDPPLDKPDSDMPKNLAAPENFTGENKYRWNQENYSRQRRYIDIWYFVLSFLNGSWLDNRKWTYPGGYTEAKRNTRRRRQAIWVRDTFLQLGPTFIKLGQLFSTRADLFPAEYVEELTKLQDRVPAFGYDVVAATIQRELGKSVDELFAHFAPLPLAAASLGQVHQAQLHSGEEVVVKIQRPGLKKLFTIDLEILRGIAQYFQNHPKWGKGRDWMGIYDECCKILWEETDYLLEGQNADTFRRNFRTADWVKVPRIFWRYSSPQVLTLEYMPGIKISDYEALEQAGIDRKQIAVLSAHAYLRQILADGFFHADPHPGNVAVSDSGQLIFYDFGMMGRIASLTKGKLMGTLSGVMQRNADQVLSSLVELGVLVPTGDVGPLRRSIQYLLDNVMDKSFESQSIAQIGDDLYEIAYDQPFRFPATFTFVMRAFSTIEGVGKGLDPDFNFMEAAQPFALQLMTNNNLTPDAGDFLGELGRQAAQVSSSALGLPRRIEDTIEKLERGDLRVRVRSTETDRIIRRMTAMQQGTNYALITGSLILSTTLLFVNKFQIPATVMGIMALLMAIVLIRHLRRIEKADRMF